MKLKNIPIGTLVHKIEMRPGQGGKIARSAGSYAQIWVEMVNMESLRVQSGR